MLDFGATSLKSGPLISRQGPSPSHVADASCAPTLSSTRRGNRGLAFQGSVYAADDRSE
jgi:hypothetical protein